MYIYIYIERERVVSSVSSFKHVLHFNNSMRAPRRGPSRAAPPPGGSRPPTTRTRAPLLGISVSRKQECSFHFRGLFQENRNDNFSTLVFEPF